MLINSLEKDPQAFWGSIDSFFYKTITPSDKNNIDTLIAQLSESSPGKISNFWKTNSNSVYSHFLLLTLGLGS